VDEENVIGRKFHDDKLAASADGLDYLFRKDLVQSFMGSVSQHFGVEDGYRLYLPALEVGTYAIDHIFYIRKLRHYVSMLHAEIDIRLRAA
jgi:hypothetical protein